MRRHPKSNSQRTDPQARVHTLQSDPFGLSKAEHDWMRKRRKRITEYVRPVLRELARSTGFEIDWTNVGQLAVAGLVSTDCLELKLAARNILVRREICLHVTNAIRFDAEDDPRAQLIAEEAQFRRDYERAVNAPLGSQERYSAQARLFTLPANWRPRLEFNIASVIQHLASQRASSRLGPNEIEHALYLAMFGEDRCFYSREDLTWYLARAVRQLIYGDAPPRLITVEDLAEMVGVGSQSLPVGADGPDEPLDAVPDWPSEVPCSLNRQDIVLVRQVFTDLPKDHTYELVEMSTGAPNGNVRVRAFRVRKKLRELLLGHPALAKQLLRAIFHAPLERFPLRGRRAG